MHQGKLVFSQVMAHLPLDIFHDCVRRYDGERKVKTFSCLDQFYCMAFAQLTYRESLRDIEACLGSQARKLWHMGIRGGCARNTLSNANNTRNWRIYADLASALIAVARPLYANDAFGVDLANAVYALDASTIDLCLSVFPWAKFRTTKAGIKLHTLLDLRGNIPSVLHISNAKWHEVNWLDSLLLEAGAIYLMDRGYLDFERLYRFTHAGAFFVTRAKHNTQMKRIISRVCDKTNGVLSDQEVLLSGHYARKKYPLRLRRVRFKDSETGKILVFLTNHFTLPADTIAALYKQRWQVELFFKWIKQHLRIKAFVGESENAVKTQIWIAVCVYLLVAILKKRSHLPHSLYQILQVISVNCFEKTEVIRLFDKTIPQIITAENANQLNLLL
jgi:hypothetical protein